LRECIITAGQTVLQTDLSLADTDQSRRSIIHPLLSFLKLKTKNNPLSGSLGTMIYCAKYGPASVNNSRRFKNETEADKKCVGFQNCMEQ
jgi:hypothetical protein